MTTSSNKMIFVAYDAEYGKELWFTDGTAAGTHLLKDINPGSGHGFYREYEEQQGYGNRESIKLNALDNGKAIFAANDGVHGYELWITDGTTEGTQLLKDIQEGASGNGTPLSGMLKQTYATSLGNGQTIFAANDGVHGQELWVTNGTAEGTYLLKDIRNGTADGFSGDSFVANIGNGRVIFAANDGIHGSELWVTDGTTAGTQLLKDINQNGLGIGSLGASSASAASTFSYNNVLLLENGKTIFRANDGVHGDEVWVTDGTTAGTQLLLDINVIADSFGQTNSLVPGSYSNFVPVGNGKAMFTANDGIHGAEWWVTDGTSAGTHLLKDIQPEQVLKPFYDSSNNFLGYQYQAIAINDYWVTPIADGKVLFSAYDEVHGSELWITDGTEAGTHLAYDFYTGGQTQNVDLIDADGQPTGQTVSAYFPNNSAGMSGNSLLMASTGDGQAVVLPWRADSSTNYSSIWLSDGTQAGTEKLYDTNLSGLYRFTTLDGGFLFYSTNGQGSNLLWFGDYSGSGLSSIALPSAIDSQIVSLYAKHLPLFSGTVGDDILTGSTAADLLKGGKGNDVYYVNHLDDQIAELKDQGFDRVISSVNYTLGNTYVEQLELSGKNHLKLIGNTLANSLIGNDGNNTLDGGKGIDTLIGGKGNDAYYIDHIDDVVTELAGQGTDKIFSSVSYSIANTAVENMELLGTAGRNLTGNDSANILIGNAGNNILDGAAGADTLKGGIGNDTYYVDNSTDKVIEYANEGTDVVFSSADFNLFGYHVEQLELVGTNSISATGNSLNNSLMGNDSNNTLNGANGADRLYGRLGNDTLNGDAGNDMLDGGGDRDILKGGAGQDSYYGGTASDTAVYDVLNSADARGGNGSDVWYDFTVGNASSVNADKIDISALLADYTGDGSAASLSGYIKLMKYGEDTVIRVDRDGATGQSYQLTSLLTLKNVDIDLATLVSNQQILV